MQAEFVVADFEEFFSSGDVAVVVTGTGFVASTGLGGNILLPSGFLSTT